MRSMEMRADRPAKYIGISRRCLAAAALAATQADEASSPAGPAWACASAEAGARPPRGCGGRRCGGPTSDPNSTGCVDASWSPDGKKIVLSLFTAATGQVNIYTVNADGTGLFQVTHGVSTVPGEGDIQANWGTHPLIK
jgi:hypothetical protein